MASDHSSSSLCPDWVFSNLSNAHACKDREWFSDYTPFRSVTTDLFGNELEIQGVGTVILPVKRSPYMQGPQAHGTLRLTNVLHAPSAVCNVISSPIFNDYHVIIAGGGGSICDKQRNPVAYFKDNSPLYNVQLSEPPFGPAVGPSSLSPDDLYVIRVTWSPSERDRFEALRSKEHRGGQAEPTQESNPPYTAGEKKWLKENYGGEFKFLVAYGLSIYKEEEREEGRLIARALIDKGD